MGDALAAHAEAGHRRVEVHLDAVSGRELGVPDREAKGIDDPVAGHVEGGPCRRRQHRLEGPGPLAGHDLGLAAVGARAGAKLLEAGLLLFGAGDRQAADPPKRCVERGAERLPARARPFDQLGLERAGRTVGPARRDARVALRGPVADVARGLDERDAGGREREPAGDRTPPRPRLRR